MGRRGAGGVVTTVKLPKIFLSRLKAITGQRTATQAVRLACEEGVRFARRRRLQALAGTLRLAYLDDAQRADARRDWRLARLAQR